MITTPFKATFQGEYHTQNVKYISNGPPLNMKLVAKRPPRVVLVGSSKYLQNVSLHFHGPPQQHLETCLPDTLGTFPLQTVVILSNCAG